MILEVENLSVAYSKIEALHDVSFRVEAKRIVSIIGSNGAGKTTLLNAISAVVRRKAGRLLFEGKPLPTSPHRVVAAGIAQVPEGRRVFSALTVEENLIMGGYLASKAELETRRKEVYELFPILRERREQHAGTLSGGEQQMLAIGRALMSRPKMILLDEPSLGLAPKIVAQVFELIKKINQSGTTVVLVEQNARKALATADYAYVLENGRITLEGPASKLAADPAVEAAYLGDHRPTTAQGVQTE